MLMRYFALAVMFVSYTFWVGHDVIPHHHHDNTNQANHHSHGEDHEEGEGMLKHILSLVEHSAIGFQTNNETVKKLERPQADFLMVFAVVVKDLLAFPSDGPLLVPEESVPIYVSQSRSCVGLRAPPFEIA